MFSRANGHRLHVFPRLAPATHLVALGSGYMPSRALHTPHAFLAPATCFPRLARVIDFLYKFRLVYWGIQDTGSRKSLWRLWGTCSLRNNPVQMWLLWFWFHSFHWNRVVNPVHGSDWCGKKTSCTETGDKMKYSSQELLDPRILFLVLQGENCHDM